MKLRQTALSFAIAAALFSPSAFSIGYSAVKTQSFLYEPLKVQVLLNLSPDEDYSQSSIQLATPIQFKQAGMNYPLNAGDLSVRTDRRNKGGLSVLVQSNKPIYDPAIKLLFEVKNNGSSLLVPINVLLDVPFSSSMNPLFQAQLPHQASSVTSGASSPSLGASVPTALPTPKIKAKSNFMPLLPDATTADASGIVPKVKKKPSVVPLESSDSAPMTAPAPAKRKKYDAPIEPSNVVAAEKPRIKSSSNNHDYDSRISALEQGQQRLEKGQANMEKHLIQIGDQLSKMSLKQPLQPSLPVNTNQEVQVKHSTASPSIEDPVVSHSSGNGSYNSSDTPAVELNSSSPSSSSASSDPDVNFNPTTDQPSASEPVVSTPVAKRPISQNPVSLPENKDSSFVDLILSHLPYVLAGALTLGLGAYYMVRRRRAMKEYQSSTLGADTTLSFPQEPVDQTPSSEIKTPQRKFNPSRSTPSPLADDVSDLKQSIFSTDADLMQSEPTGRGFFDSTRTETVVRDKEPSNDLEFSSDLSFPESSKDPYSIDSNSSSSQDIDSSFSKASMVAKVTASRSLDRNDLVRTFTPSDSVPDGPARLQLELACLYAQSQDWDSARVTLKEILMDQSQSIAHAEAKNLLAKIDAMI